jgi:hypothetical protein
MLKAYFIISSIIAAGKFKKAVPELPVIHPSKSYEALVKYSHNGGGWIKAPTSVPLEQRNVEIV